MPRPVILGSGPWTDVPLEALAQKAGEWGYQGLELACSGDHFEVQRALGEADYCQKKLDLLSRNDLQVSVLYTRVGQAVSDPVDQRHQAILPDYVWGDGDPEGVRQRAAEEMIATVQAAQKLGVNVVSGYTGSPMAAWMAGFPPASPDQVAEGVQQFAQQWLPILDACGDAGLRFALEVGPGQIAFDFYSAEQALEAVAGREEFGFTFNPAPLHWQGIDPVEFLRRFADRIYHVHFKDVALSLNGKSSILGWQFPQGDVRRGWHYRSPGHGGIDWEAVIRALNDIRYDGPLAVDWQDGGMNRDCGAEEACKFLKRLNFEPAPAGEVLQPSTD